MGGASIGTAPMPNSAHQVLAYLIKRIQETDGDLSLIDVKDLTLEIKIAGEAFDSSITGEVARALWGLQEGIYRAGAAIIHGQPNIKKLTPEEREQLTLSFKVEPGCTSLKAVIGQAASGIVKGFQDMDSKDKKAVLVSACTCVLLGYGITEVCNTFKIQGAQDAEIEKVKATMEPINNAIQAAAKFFAKSSKDADEVSFGPQRFSRKDIEQLNAKTRSSANTETMPGVFFVKGVHEGDDHVLRVDLVDAETHEAFSALIPPKGLFEEELPNSSAAIGRLIDAREKIEATLLIKETRNKIERVVIDWRTPANRQGPSSE